MSKLKKKTNRKREWWGMVSVARPVEQMLRMLGDVKGMKDAATGAIIESIVSDKLDELAAVDLAWAAIKADYERQKLDAPALKRRRAKYEKLIGKDGVNGQH